MTTIQEKKQLLKVIKEEVKQLEEEIAKCSLEEKSQRIPTLPERFPIGSNVHLIGKSEKYRLRRKRAVVVGHTTCFVKLERKEETFIRAPENLKLIENGDQKKESTGSSGAR